MLTHVQANQEIFKEHYWNRGAHKDSEEINLQISAHSVGCTQPRALSNNLGHAALNYNVPLEEKGNVNTQSHLVAHSSTYRENEK